VGADQQQRAIDAVQQSRGNASVEDLGQSCPPVARQGFEIRVLAKG
jgi:hypothetical protein